MSGQAAPVTNNQQAPWYSFNRIDNFGSIDPQGNYYKPDSNILTPPGYPITALMSGTVTSVQRTSWGQTVVTVKLDNALNNLATHTFYEHMHDATVTPGQHLNAGDPIGHANYTGEGANLGFGLYSGDVYGSGGDWNTLQNDLKPGGAGLLNPVPILNAAKKGTLSATAYYTPKTGLTATPPGQCQGWWDVSCWINQTQGWLTGIGERIAIFVIGLVMIILGFILLAERETKQVLQGASKLAMLGA